MKNLTDYIDSGVLEQYVLGELAAAERAAVEEMARREPAVQQELNDLTAGLEVYTQAQAQTPPAGLRERVLAGALAQIQAPSQSKNDGAAPVAPASASAKPAQPASVQPVAEAPSPLRVSSREEATGAGSPAPVAAAPSVRPLYEAAPARTPRWAMAASVALLLSLLGNAVLYTRWQQTDEQLVAVQNEQAAFAANTQVVNQRLAETQQEIAVLRDDRFQAVALAGTKAAPSARARVFYNATTKAVYVDVRQLPALPTGKQYQLWALDNGKPVDAGTLAAATATGQGLQQMKDIARAQAFAMTVEPAGGSINPTLSTMTVMGAVAGS